VQRRRTRPQPPDRIGDRAGQQFLVRGDHGCGRQRRLPGGQVVNRLRRDAGGGPAARHVPADELGGPGEVLAAGAAHGDGRVGERAPEPAEVRAAPGIVRAEQRGVVALGRGEHLRGVAPRDRQPQVLLRDLAGDPFPGEGRDRPPVGPAVRGQPAQAVVVVEPLRQLTHVVAQRVRGEVGAGLGLRPDHPAVGLVQGLRGVAGRPVTGHRQPGPLGAVGLAGQPGERQQVVGVAERRGWMQAEHAGQAGQRAQPLVQHVGGSGELPRELGDLPGAQPPDVGVVGG
jgi:hypothetical protein